VSMAASAEPRSMARVTGPLNAAAGWACGLAFRAAYLIAHRADHMMRTVIRVRHSPVQTNANSLNYLTSVFMGCCSHCPLFVRTAYVVYTTMKRYGKSST
jgi:hypothetical protein